jgi:hypothetical protein
MGLLHADNVMHSIAQLSGGQAYFPRYAQQFPGIYEAINRDLRNQYALGYVSSWPTVAGKFRKLRVEVALTDLNADRKPEKLKVRHRSGYRR